MATGIFVVVLVSAGPGARTEEIETLDATAVEAARPHWFAEVSGELHHGVCHFPIAWLVLVFLAEIVSLRRSQPVISGVFGIALTAASFAPAVASGFARSLSYDDPEELAEIALHRNIMIGAAILCVGALLLRFRRFHSPWTTTPYLALLAAATVLVLVGGYLGGRIVHGDDHLF